MPQSFASGKSPAMTPRKKSMTWKELEQATASAKKKNRGKSKSNIAQSPMRRSLSNTPIDINKSPTTTPSDQNLAYRKTRRKRLAKKAHLLGNRGNGTGIMSPEFSNTPQENLSLAMNNVGCQNKWPVPTLVGKLLMTPSPNAGGKLSFSAEKHRETSSVKKTATRKESATTPTVISNQDQKSSGQRTAVKSPPRAKSSPAAKASQRSATPQRSVAAKTPPRARNSPAAKGSARRNARTPPRATSTLRTPGTPQGRTPLKALPLSVQRDKESRKRCGRSASPVPSSAATRRNLDKRTARLLYSEDFALEIANFRQGKRYLNNGANHEGETNLFMRGHDKSNGVAFFVRKRPIFEYELGRGEFDVVSVDGSTRYDSDQVIIHSAQMHCDMRHKLVKHISFPCSAAFDEHCSNDNLYRHVAKPLVLSVAKSGIATLVMYGQTGSGKTHTMAGIEERAARDLFHAIPVASEVKMQFVELSGKLVKDLLDKKKSDVRIIDQEDGSVRLLNANYVEVMSPEELSRLMSMAKSRRATEATDVNGVSSRSHAVCQITVTNREGRSVLTLIDCAGSERRNDSLYHSSDRQKESTEINASLFALKECIRARSQQKTHVPYRSSSLTRILRETLEQKGSKLCIVATVAPNATDTEHTLETLKTVASLVGSEGIELVSSPRASAPESTPAKESNSRKSASKTAGLEDKLVSPKQWSHEELLTWMQKKKLVPKSSPIPATVDGRGIMRMSKLQLRTLVYGEGERAKAEKLFLALRAESDRVDKAKFKQRMSSA